MKAFEVIKHYENRRPTKWICRELDCSTAFVNKVLNLAGGSPNHVRVDLDEYDYVDSLVRVGHSLWRIHDLSGWDTRKILQWFPNVPQREGKGTKPYRLDNVCRYATFFRRVAYQLEASNAPYRVVAWDLSIEDSSIKRREVREIAKVCGFVSSAQSEMSPATHRKINILLEDGCSLSEVSRTTGVGIQAIKRWFPEAGWPQGGSKESAMVRKSRDLLEKAGEKYATG